MPVRFIPRPILRWCVGATWLAFLHAGAFGLGPPAAWSAENGAHPATGDDPPRAETREAVGEWTAMFDGRTLEGWKETNFGGEGGVTVEDGHMVLEFGQPLTGITWDGDFPRQNYEIALEAARLDGIDFFCGLTFPVEDSHASLIVGGWAGSVVGISSLDGKDASENETTHLRRFEKGRWYSIRLRVTEERIQAWIDDERIVDVDPRGRRITTRNEVTLSQPVGIAAFETLAGLRHIRYRRVDGPDQDDN